MLIYHFCPYDFIIIKGPRNLFPFPSGAFKKAADGLGCRLGEKIFRFLYVIGSTGRRLGLRAFADGKKKTPRKRRVFVAFGHI